MKRLIILMVGTFLIKLAYGQVISTNNFTPIMQACVQADDQTLVIFDIDDVLVTMIDAIFQTNERYDFFVHHLNAYVQKDWMYDVWQDCSLCLVDKEILNILKLLRNNTIPTLALTFGCAGPKGF